MAKASYHTPGRIIDYRNSGETDIGLGDVVSLTDMVGVAADIIPAGKVGGLEIAGVFNMPAVNSAAFTVGQKVYWDATNGVVTATATDTKPCGYAVVAKASAAAVALVKIG